MASMKHCKELWGSDYLSGNESPADLRIQT